MGVTERGQIQTLSDYHQRMYGVPEVVSESTLWARQGFIDVGTLATYARGMNKAPGHARDIGGHAMRALLATPTYYKAMNSVEPNTVVAHHLFDNMEIFHKLIEKRDDQGVPTTVRPGLTQEQFLDQHAEPWMLLQADEWVVSMESVRGVHHRLQSDLGQFVVDGVFERRQLENVGDDEMQVLRWAALLGSSALHAA